MITINEIKIGEVAYLTGKIGKESYSIEHTDDLQKQLAVFSNACNIAENHAEAKKALASATALINAAKNSVVEEYAELAPEDLYFKKKTNTYHIKHEDKISTIAVPQFIVDKMIFANDKGISAKPWLIFWVRLMRNKLYKNSPAKVEQIIAYLKATYVDEKNVEKLVKEGFSDTIANKLSKFDQISITEQGILAAFKYVSLLDKKFVVEKDEKTGEQVIKQVNKYERKLEVDEVTGEITKDELELPDHSEAFSFEPPCMGQNGDAFTCKDVDDTSSDPTTAHVVKVGKVHELPEGFAQVNTSDSSWGVKGLHLGGYYYVQGFGGATDYLVDCLVSPEDIGAVADVTRHDGEGAIRCKRYYVVGAHFCVSKGMYHPSQYAKLLDGEWAQYKADAIKGFEESIEEVKKS